MLNPKRIAALLLLSLAGCLADAADVEDPRHGAAGPEVLTSEWVGEAAQDVTRADCYEKWHHNVELCKLSPPELQQACMAACAGLLAACLALADG